MKHLLILCILTSNLLGQVGMIEFKKTINAYNTIQQMSFEVELFALEHKTSKTQIPIGKGLGKKQGSYFYSKFDENEMLQREGTTLMINTDEKKIDYYISDMKQAKAAQLDIDFNAIIDSLATEKDSSFVYEGIKSGLKKFRKTTEDEVIQRTDFYVDPNTNLIVRIVYYYAESNEDHDIPFTTVTINYKNYKFTPIPLEYFALSKFVQKSGNGYVGGSAYKGYKVHVHSSKHKS